jgi:hypothetical protein
MPDPALSTRPLVAGFVPHIRLRTFADMPRTVYNYR